MSTRQPIFDLLGSLSDAEDAIAQAGANANPSWKQAALEAVRKVALRLPAFTTDPIWAELGGFPNTHDSRAMGYIIRQAVSLGYIENTGRTERTSRRSNHARPLTVWKSLLCKRP